MSGQSWGGMRVIPADDIEGRPASNEGRNRKNVLDQIVGQLALISNVTGRREEDLNMPPWRQQIGPNSMAAT